MKTVISLLISFASILLLRGTVQSQTQEVANSVAHPHKPSPFACSRLALSPELRTRHFDVLGPALVKLRKSVRELPDGYEFEFPADETTYQLLVEWAGQERLCCPFFEISLRFDRDEGPLWLRLTGRKGVKEFIQVDAGPWLKQ
jgi:hypothetical protein